MCWSAVRCCKLGGCIVERGDLGARGVVVLLPQGLQAPLGVVFVRFGGKTGFGKPQVPTSPFSAKDRAAEKATPSTPKLDNQLTCYHCRAKGYFRYNCTNLDNQLTCYHCRAKGRCSYSCPKLVTVSIPKTSQNLVALLMCPDQGRNDKLIALLGH